MQLPPCYLFHGLSEAQVERVASIAKDFPIEKGQWIFHEGREGSEFYILKEGEVELLTNVNGYFELPVSMLRSPGSAFGIASLVPPYTYTLSVRCARSGMLMAIRHDDLTNLMESDHELGCLIMKNLAQYLLERLRETRDELKVHFRTLFQATH
jgi:CRP-like cAMP-binding protein